MRGIPLYDMVPSIASLVGSTSQRPPTGYVGMSYRDTTLGSESRESADAYGRITAWENALGRTV